jgi:hypothetical protein
MQPAILLNDQQRAMLRAAARVGRNYQHDNKDLEVAIAQLKSINPGAFYTDETLILRKFWHAPKFPIPHQYAAVIL